MIYLDHHATTKVDAQVLRKMNKIYSKNILNKEEHLWAAKQEVSCLIRSEPENIYFASSATEINNIILKTSAADLVITTNSEHSSVRESLNSSDSIILKINLDGTLDYNALKAILIKNKNKKKLVSIIFAHNEIGTIHNIKLIGQLCKKHKAIFHTDAAQALGRTEIDVNEMNIDFLTMSSHKIYGPLGVGALYARDINKISPIISGGYQNYISSGTPNLPAIVGFGEACRISKKNIAKGEIPKIAKLRDYLLHELEKKIPGLIVNGTMKNRLCNNLNIAIPGFNSEVFIKTQEKIIISAGSACLFGEPSEVIMFICPYPESVLRFGLGRDNTKKEIDKAVAIIYNHLQGGHFEKEY